jgi:hypothetical protein
MHLGVAFGSFQLEAGAVTTSAFCPAQIHAPRNRLETLVRPGGAGRQMLMDSGETCKSGEEPCALYG